MTREDIDLIIKTLCPNDEDYEKPCISPAYLRKELEELSLDALYNDIDSKTLDKFTEEELKQHIFELSLMLDSKSAGRDYVALRSTHYLNQQWLHDKGLQKEYYQYFCKNYQRQI